MAAARNLRPVRVMLAGLFLFAGCGLGSAADQRLHRPAPGRSLIDEVRIGASGTIDPGLRSEEGGVFVNAEMLFARPTARFDNRFLDIALRPRPTIGATVGVGGGTNQLYAGATWHIPLGELVFFELGFGGTIHDQDIGRGSVSAGCRILFRESAALGFNVTERLRILATVDHASHAELCSGRNAGLTHAGVSVGFRF